jgi:hypothetical protein
MHAVNVFWHLGHLTFLPRRLSGTRRAALHEGQRIRLGMIISLVLVSDASQKRREAATLLRSVTNRTFALIRNQAKYLMRVQAGAATEKRQLDKEGATKDLAASFLNQAATCLHGAAGGQQIIDEQHLRSG